MLLQRDKAYHKGFVAVQSDALTLVTKYRLGELEDVIRIPKAATKYWLVQENAEGFDQEELVDEIDDDSIGEDVDG